ncbi:glycoside hydrolase family 25 protein [Pseudomonas sp. RT4P38]
MKISTHIALLIMTCSGAYESTIRAEAVDEYSQPWRKETAALIIDPYEENNINWKELSKDTRVVAIIHKATQGMKADKKYSERRAEAKKRGYLWGSYHLGLAGNPIAQADNYLKVSEVEGDDLIALDLEELSSKFMSLENAKIFMRHIADKTGRLPVLYANHAVTQAIIKDEKSGPFLMTSPLWYARFLKTIPDFPKGGWKTYEIWQFSSEINCKPGKACLYRVPGTSADMDINVFNGSAQELKAKWPLTPKYSNNP